MANLGKVIYLTEAQKNELFAQGTITSNNRTITYSENDLYVTPDKSIDSIQLNGTTYIATNGVVNLGNVLTSANNTIIAPIESSSTASQLYNQGDIFIYNDQLYRATSTIATSTSITPNTNCEEIQIIDLIEEKYTKPSTGIPASDLASGAIPVTDVQINSSSILSSGVANIPICSSSTFGVVKVDANSFGIKINQDGRLFIDTPSFNEMKAGTQAYKPIVAATQHTSVFYGLAKAAGDTSQASSDNTVGTYTTTASAAIRSMLGITEIPSVTSSDNGKVLRVVNGAWAAVSLPSASGVSF